VSGRSDRCYYPRTLSLDPQMMTLRRDAMSFISSFVFHSFVLFSFVISDSFVRSANGGLQGAASTRTDVGKDR